jgi:hypothetical protein
VTVDAPSGDLTERLTLLKDPASGGSEAEIRAQTALATDIQSDINSAVEMINNLETVRAQVATTRASLAADSSLADVRAATDSIDRTLTNVEERLFQMRVTGRGQDILRWPMQVTEQLMYLAGSITSSDLAPTTQHRAVAAMLKERLGRIRAAYVEAMSTKLDAYRQFLRQRAVPNVIIP